MHRAAVVRREDDDRVVRESKLIQLLEHATDAPVHALKHRGINGVALAAALWMTIDLDHPRRARHR